LVNKLTYYIKLYIIYDDEYLYYVHAGLGPEIPIGKQAKNDMIWIREEFSYSTCIDTGCAYGEC